MAPQIRLGPKRLSGMATNAIAITRVVPHRINPLYHGEPADARASRHHRTLCPRALGFHDPCECTHLCPPRVIAVDPNELYMGPRVHRDEVLVTTRAVSKDVASEGPRERVGCLWPVSASPGSPQADWSRGGQDDDVLGKRMSSVARTIPSMMQLGRSTRGLSSTGHSSSGRRCSIVPNRASRLTTEYPSGD